MKIKLNKVKNVVVFNRLCRWLSYKNIGFACFCKNTKESFIRVRIKSWVFDIINVCHR